MNNRGAGAPSADQSPLSLLVNAADSRDGARAPGDAAGAQSFMTDSLRRTLAGESGLSLEEQLLLHQQLQGPFGGAPSPSMGFLGQLQREQALLSQLGQQQQLAALLGLGGGSSASNDFQMALASAQLRQQQAPPQLTHADLLALSHSGAFGGGGGGGGGGSAASGGFASAMGGNLSSDIDSLQWLEELERRQRLYGVASAASGGAPSAAAPPPPAPAPVASGVRSIDMGSDRAANAQQQPQAKLSRAEAAPSDHRGKSRAGLSSPKVKSEPASEAEAAAAAAAVAEENKEELEKAPGSVIVPCRARGMPMDHNFKTAYFVIPENVKHGEELICSYFACRNAGIKFRYCSHCKVPVAKRNFRKRHKHGGEEVARIPGDDSDGDDDGPVCKPVSNKKGIPSQITANRKQVEDSKTGGSSDSMESNSQDKVDAEEGLVRTTVSSLSKKKAAARQVPSLPYKEGTKVSFDRQKRWMELLEKRPSTKDGDSMSTWLMEVLAVSDLDTPLKPADDNPFVSDSDKARAKSAMMIGKKMKARPAPESPRSETGYGSSNDDSNIASKKKQKDTKKAPPPAAAASAAAAAGVVKKKRPAEELSSAKKEADKSQPAEFFVSGSFAAWKERKKQKKQAKLSGQASGSSAESKDKGEGAV